MHRSRKLIVVVITAIVLLGAILILTIGGHKKSTTTNRASTSTITFSSPKAEQTSSNSPLPPASQSDITKAVQTSATAPQFSSGDFTITSSTEPATGWYVVHLRPNDGAEAAVAVVKQASDGTISLVAGPGSALDLNALQAANAPQSVINQAPVYDN